MGCFVRLYHGSKSFFDSFDPVYYRTGEGAGSFVGWFFTDNLRGAERHVISYLRHLDGFGFVYECEVPDEYVVTNCENGYTDSCYGCQSSGVLLEYSNRIKILNVIRLYR